METKPRKIPEFSSDAEEMEFWDTHSFVDYMDEGKEVKLDFSPVREKRLTQQINIRFNNSVLERTKRRADKLGVPYQTLMQLWVGERLEQEEAKAEALQRATSERTEQPKETAKAA